MESDSEFDILMEWAVWAHLDRKTELELILLKGHLLLETILETVLKRNNVNDSESFSFYRKIQLLESLEIENKCLKEFIITSLKEINLLRNKIAHDFHFDIKNGELEKWAFKIHENLTAEKFTRFTFRTKIVHSFSKLSKNILSMKIKPIAS